MPSIIFHAGWILSFAFLCLGFWILFRRGSKRWYGRGTKALLCIFASVSSLIASQLLCGLLEPATAPLALDALYRTIQVFLANAPLELSTSNIGGLGCAGPWSDMYLYYNAAVYLVAFGSTITAIISAFSDLLSPCKVRIRSIWNDVYAFSDLNQNSWLLAQSIQADGKASRLRQCLIVFANVDFDRSKALAADAKAAHMICTSLGMDVATRHTSRFCRKLSCLYMGSDEVENLDEGVGQMRLLAERGNDSENAPEVRILSSSPIASHLMDTVLHKADQDKDGRLAVKARRIDRVRSTVDLLLDRYPLFLAGDRAEDGLIYDLPSRHLLIVGSSAIAYQYLKSAIWAGCLGSEEQDIRMRIDLVAPDAEDICHQLEAEAPGLFGDSCCPCFSISSSKEGEPVPAPEKPCIQIGFNALSPDGKDFERYLAQSFRTITFVLVADGDDLDNARLSMRTREILTRRFIQAHIPEQDRVEATICAIIANDELAESLADMEGRGIPYHIHPVGTDGEVFSSRSVFNPELERLARNVNRAYSGIYSSTEPDEMERRKADKRFDSSEYSRQSSIASALHLKYKVFLYCRSMVQGLNGVMPDPEAEELLGKIDWHQPLATFDPRIVRSLIISATANPVWLQKVEHDRWDAYMMAVGFTEATEADIEASFSQSRRQDNEVAKLHYCLGDYSLLDEKSRNMDEIIRSHGKTADPKDFASVDKDLIEHIDRIVADHDR